MTRGSKPGPRYVCGEPGGRYGPCSAWLRPLCACGESGQMTVELAVIVPVVIVVALTVFNLMRFVEVCAVFDQVALDAVISQGVSPAGELSEVASVGAVEHCIEDALASERCTVSVSTDQATTSVSGGKGIVFPVSPLLTDFTCTLTYRPWPSSFVIAGVAYESPVVLTHSRSIVVDRFRPGVVI